MTVDAHQHVWDLRRAADDRLGPQHGPIFRTVEAEERAGTALRVSGIDAARLAAVEPADRRSTDG